MRSIAIIGKGPSINRCNRKYIDKYQDVAICGRPIFNKYEKLIGERAHYDFCNCGDPRIYSEPLIRKLGIKKVINTNKYIPRNRIKHTSKVCPNWIEYDPNGRLKTINSFKKYKLDPSSGTIAIEYLLQTKKYNKIGIFGFDLMEVGEDVYYFGKTEVQSSLQRLYKLKIYSNNNKILKKCGHDKDKTFKYMCDIIQNNPQIKFEILSNRKFPKFNNLTIV